MHQRPLRARQRLYERLIRLLIHGAVDVVALSPAVAVGGKGLGKIDARSGDDGGGGVVKIEVAAQLCADILRQIVQSQRPRGDDARPLRDGFHLFADDLDIFIFAYLAGDVGGKRLAVYRQSAARGHARGVRRLDDERTQDAHLLFQEAAGIAEHVVALQRIAAHELGIAGAAVRGGELLRLALDEPHKKPVPGQKVRRLAARKARPHYRDLCSRSAHPSVRL